MHYILLLLLVQSFMQQELFAQSDTTKIAMNAFMAKDPGGNTSPANISMWPNPANGNVKLYINSLQLGDRGQFVVFNTAGKSCLTGNINTGTNNIYLAALPDGVYFIRVLLQNKIAITKKLVVVNKKA
jgi:hypothetical protein